jgi:hypothetical protein
VPIAHAPMAAIPRMAAKAKRRNELDMATQPLAV